jgi:SAM-dependent methyltransferase
VSTADREKWNKRYREGAYAERVHPSALLAAWIDRIPRGKAIDVACGAGRNALYLAEHGFHVDAVDISCEALDRARDTGQRLGLRVNWLEHDLDQALEPGAMYQLILVIRYVNLPLIRQLIASLAPGGFLICEQHLVTEEDVIGPTSPAYRVKAGDLLSIAGKLRIHHLEESLVREPDGRTAALARLVAQSA